MEGSLLYLLNTAKDNSVTLTSVLVMACVCLTVSCLSVCPPTFLSWPTNVNVRNARGRNAFAERSERGRRSPNTIVSRRTSTRDVRGAAHTTPRARPETRMSREAARGETGEAVSIRI